MELFFSLHRTFPIISFIMLQTYPCSSLKHGVKSLRVFIYFSFSKWNVLVRIFLKPFPTQFIMGPQKGTHINLTYWNYLLLQDLNKFFSPELYPHSFGHYGQILCHNTSFKKMSWFEYWKHAFLKVIRMSCKVLYQHFMLLRYVGIVFWMQKNQRNSSNGQFQCFHYVR